MSKLATAKATADTPRTTNTSIDPGFEQDLLAAGMEPAKEPAPEAAGRAESAPEAPAPATTHAPSADAPERAEQVFSRLNAVNVNGHTEKKTTDGGRQTLTYLSWAWAWAEVVKRYEDANYEVARFDGLPYQATPLGIMVETAVTIRGVTRSMWLPVMDGANKPMKTEPYTYTVMQWENGQRVRREKTVAAATMFDVNKALMRCLTKNLAMFGLGLYIYAGEDLPEESDGDEAAPVLSAKRPMSAPTQDEIETAIQCLEMAESRADVEKVWTDNKARLGTDKAFIAAIKAAAARFPKDKEIK